MREIKFRAFDKVIEKMYEVGYIDFAKKRVQLATVRESVCYAVYISPLKDVELMQYTGFKDENGTEIFEKDIVHTVGVIPGVEIDDVGIVKFIDGSWMVENLDGNDGWELFQEGAEVEVLGNVFENPELLKGDGNNE
ncbi:YopX family protein [Bacillus pseudomycoides]|uniref:YopX family protein n=1 Tax=Bacillus pseudomycoides TaxID=64104 RepID=UPI001F0B0FB0|nr:YopX family protein [Bacillus pseudomycoides]